MNYSVEFELYRYSPYVGLFVYIYLLYIYSLQCCALSIENSFYATFMYYIVVNLLYECFLKQKEVKLTCCLLQH